MPSSKEYQVMFKALGDRFQLPPVESLQTAIMIDMLAILERTERKSNGSPRSPRKSKPSK